MTATLLAGTIPGPVSHEAAPDAQATARALAEDLWNSHGASAYALASALLGDEAAAMRAVALGMTDFVGAECAEGAEGAEGQGSPLDSGRAMGRHVYTRAMEQTWTSSTVAVPAMAWLAQLAQLQRACLALCVFGGHTYREAAALLEISPAEVLQLLSSGLQELTPPTTEESMNHG